MSTVSNINVAREQAFAKTAARERLNQLFDPDTFVELGGFAQADGAPSGVVCGYGAVSGGPVYAFAQDSAENGGAVGKTHAAKIKKLYDMALKTGAPVIGIYDSKGVKVSEGAGSLAAAAELLQAVSSLSGVVPQISLILGPCVGTGAMAALSADFVIMSEKADFYATPANASTPEGAGTAEAAAKSGVAHIVAKDDAAAIAQAQKLISMLPINNLAAAPVAPYGEVPGAGEALRAACENMAGAKAEDIAAALADAGSAVELFAAFGEGVYAATATMTGFPCGVLATRGGALSSDDCAKMARLISIWDSFQLPVITLVDCTGMQGAEGALCVNARDMARLAHLYNEATTAKLSVITGKAYGAAFTTLASGMDYVVAWPSAVISPLEPSVAVAFQYAGRITAGHAREKVEDDSM
jgi:acetyl-CoA carboxylase carboxyltransferase component